MLLALMMTAQAGDLEYRWPTGEPLHYRAQVALAMPTGMSLMGENNLDVKVDYIEYALVMTCTPQAPGKKDQTLSCDVGEAKFLGTGREREQEEINVLMDEFATRLASGTILVTFTKTGRMKTVDLEGVAKDNQRSRAGYEVLRRLSGRALSPLEVELPKDGADPGKAWKQKVSYAMTLPTTTSSGVVKIENVTSEGEGGLVTITSSGQGTVADQATYDSPGVNNTTGVLLTGTSSYDPARGLIVQSGHRVQGSFTASATVAGNSLVFDQVAGIELLSELPEPSTE